MRTPACLIVYGLLLALVLGQDCPYKECYCGFQEIFCNGISLTEMPHKINSTVQFSGNLNLDNNAISTIQDNSLPSNLTGISLQFNPVETIDDAAFDGSLNTMQSLTFSRARFTEIPKAVLRLNAVNLLHISDTQILVWDDEGMRHLGISMETLILNSVGLTLWPSWIKIYLNLTYLSITGNSITYLPDDALDQVASTLRGIELHNNSLTAIPKTLSSMTSLGSLTLYMNKITDITWFPQLCQLNSLLMSKNHISDAALLSKLLRVHGDTLETFDISSNHLTSIPDMPYFKLMTDMDFSDNHISDPSSGTLRSDLTQLKLDNNYLPSMPRIMLTLTLINDVVITHNRITTVRSTDFLNTTTGLDLGHNLITELTDTSFPEYSKIEILFLNNNPLSQISPGALQNLPRLSRLYIQYTKLARLPLGIEFLSNIYIMDFTGSNSLVCTCMEKNLQKTISSMRSYNILGNCGETSIYTFFTELIQDCPEVVAT